MLNSWLDLFLLNVYIPTSTPQNQVVNIDLFDDGKLILSQKIGSRV